LAEMILVLVEVAKNTKAATGHNTLIFNFNKLVF